MSCEKGDNIFLSSIRNGLRLVLLVCFLVSLIHALWQLIAEETSVSISYERLMPLPDITICNFMTKAIDITNLTLVDYLKSDVPLMPKQTQGSAFSRINGSVHGDIEDVSRTSLLEVSTVQSIAVTNGGPIKCVTLESPLQDLDTKMGIVSNPRKI